MTSNLPPGVTDSMIPGNRPEDAVFDDWLDGKVGDILYELARTEAYGGILVGEAVVDVLEKLQRELDRLPGDPLQ